MARPQRSDVKPAGPPVGVVAHHRKMPGPRHPEGDQRQLRAGRPASGRQGKERHCQAGGQEVAALQHEADGPDQQHLHGQEQRGVHGEQQQRIPRDRRHCARAPQDGDESGTRREAHERVPRGRKSVVQIPELAPEADNQARDAVEHRPDAIAERQPHRRWPRRRGRTPHVVRRVRDPSREEQAAPRRCRVLT